MAKHSHGQLNARGKARNAYVKKHDQITEGEAKAFNTGFNAGWTAGRKDIRKRKL